MRLRKPCKEHGRYDVHDYWDKLSQYYERCPGGEFLPEGTLVIEKVDGEWPQWAIDMLEQYHYPCPPEFQEQVIKWLPTDLLDALASQVGESE